MKKNGYFLLFLIALSAVGTFFVMKPFLMSIFLAFILATMFHPTNEKMVSFFKGHRSWSSFVMCLWVMIVLIIPFFIITTMMISESDALIKELQNKNISLNFDFAKNWPIVNSIDLNSSFQPSGNFEQIAKGTQSAGNYLFSAIKAIYKGASNFLFITVVCFFALYYFFKDGDLIIKKIMKLSPLPSGQEREIFAKFNQMTVATIKGTLVIALVQGILMGITFWIAGVQAPTLWGLLTALISIIPLLGAFLIWLPVGIILILLSNYWQGIFVLVIGAVIISSVDNFLRPKLIEGQTSLHPLLVFLSTLGGIAFFGPLGFVVGPVLITLLLSLLEIYQTGHVQN